MSFLSLQFLPRLTNVNSDASSGSECFISDLFGERVSMDNTIHHLVSIFGLGAGLCYQKCGSEMVACV
ncbi:hypothetical protein Ahy_A07g035089 isoform E [Arachis hypogaea]|uniref:Uncharacterized protein n=1 Tax=Arachis hypogaea TaxID=3818 RepID=A0A445CDC2_ARAHY|nr:hypothetical protein Ahy_A07g035089 isoform E [Arachis hypogaea]